MSCSTSTWPSQWGPAPIPMVGNRQRLRYAARYGSGDQLEHDGAGAGRLAARLRISEQPLGGILISSLHPVAAERVHRLRREAEVPDHRNAPLHQRAHRLRHVAARPRASRRARPSPAALGPHSGSPPGPTPDR